MDVFRFLNPTDPTKMEQGEIINGISKKLWIERYREAGEFAFTTSANSGVKEVLPIGSFVSHQDTTEIMIVENHEIKDEKGKEAELVITGRGYESFLENRIVGSNKVFPVSGTMTDYSIAIGYLADQIVNLINEHIQPVSLIDDNNAIPYLEVISTVTPSTGTNVARTIKRGPLYNRVVELLAIDNLGIKVYRPGPTNPLGSTSAEVVFVIHQGVDKSATVVISNDSGEIETADYLWSNKKVKNAVLVTGKWVETALVYSGTVEYDRRWMYVEASDIDQGYSSAPSGSDLTDVQNAMWQRANEALMSQKEIALAKADVNKQVISSVYRTDYNVGDLVLVAGAYDPPTKMRVTEYVEIEDETGEGGYPTLTKD